jgi:hypothetical protein
MSADLFAAFGPHTSAEKGNENNHEDIEGRAISPDVLIAGIETLDIEKQRDLYQKPSKTTQQNNQPLWRQSHGGTAVLFDATEDSPEEDDDFGDFEDPKTYPKRQSTRDAASSDMLTHDLLSLDEENITAIGHKTAPSTKPYSANNTVPAADAERAVFNTLDEDDWGDFSAPPTAEAAPATERIDTVSPSMPPQTSAVEQDSTEEDWDAFEDGEPEAPLRTHAERPPSILAATQVAAVPQLRPPPKAPIPSGRADPRATETIRPSNIPPPVILLQLLPGVFDELRQTVTQSAKPHPSSPALPQRDIALAIIRAFTVAARIIAGRALRWKRDAMLAQSMRIGPAASTGGGRGMKLAAIDKSESLKEEKEAADVVGAWEKSAHLFNSTVSKVGIQRPLMALYLSVRPRLASGLDVIKASHACALCGINRDERVSQVDVNVEDSFGEYWIEHWGHRDCRDFWATYKGRLRQR